MTDRPQLTEALRELRDPPHEYSPILRESHAKREAVLQLVAVVRAALQKEPT